MIASRCAAASTCPLGIAKCTRWCLDIMNYVRASHSKTEFDFSFAIPNLARFRVTAFVRAWRGGVSDLPSTVLSLEADSAKIFRNLAIRAAGV